MYKALIFLLLMTAPFLSSGQQLQFEQLVVDKNACTCEEECCVTIKISYPGKMISKPMALADGIKKWLDDFFENKTPDDVAALFVDEFYESAESGVNWDWEVNISVVNDRAGIVSLNYTEYIYSGGAHGSGSVSFVHFDAKTGKKLLYSDFFSEANWEKLTEMGEKYFREAYGISPDTDLYDEGYEFENGFELNGNMNFTEEGIFCMYNIYEIAPYAMGPTEFTIPWEVAEKLINKKYKKLYK